MVYHVCELESILKITWYPDDFQFKATLLSKPTKYCLNKMRNEFKFAAIFIQFLFVVFSEEFIQFVYLHSKMFNGLAVVYSKTWFATVYVSYLYLFLIVFFVTRFLKR